MAGVFEAAAAMAAASTTTGSKRAAGSEGLRYQTKADGTIKGGRLAGRFGEATLVALSPSLVPFKLPNGEQVQRTRLTIVVDLAEEVNLTGESPLTGEGNAGTIHAVLCNVNMAVSGLTDPITGKPMTADNPGTLTLSLKTGRRVPDQKMIDAIYSAGPVKAKKNVTDLTPTKAGK